MNKIFFHYPSFWTNLGPKVVLFS